MHAPRGPILIVEADRPLGRAIAEQLTADGYAVELAHTAEHARVLGARRPPELALLGDSASCGAHLALLEEIRCSAARRHDWERSLPVIVLAGRFGELDLLRAFDAGADDFLALSAGYLELRARVRAILRRCDRQWDAATHLNVDALSIDLRARVATIAEQPVALRRMEFELLAHLAHEPDKVFAREDLLRVVWGYRGDCPSRTLDSHASRLRHKLARAGAGIWIVNVRGVGYRLR
jgi:DNA-binding response OmpR family regulator